MVTVKDLIERLKEYPEDIPIYWGYAEEPCWEDKKDAEIHQFPLYLENDIKQNRYIYFYDKEAVDTERKENWKLFMKFYNMSLLGHIKYWLYKK